MSTNNRKFTGFTRDPYTKAILNIDNDAYEDYKKSREQGAKVIESSKKVDILANEVSSLKEDLRSIKDLLQQMVQSTVTKKKKTNQVG